MSIKINSFGGPFVWLLRKHCSGFTSKIMLRFVARHYSGNTNKYVEYFLCQDEPPLFHNVMIETINRCNGTCSFCPANREDELRPFRKMTEEMFHGIIGQLRDMGWRGKIFLCVNNEPFVDRRILEFCRCIKSEIPAAHVALITNGTLLTPERMDEMPGVVDQIVINDYSERYTLSKTHRQIYIHIKKNAGRFEKMDVIINRRYSKEILATRAGYAPNKPKKNTEIKCACLYPFTDLVIFPDGQVGMCCNDCREVSGFGNITEDLLLDIWYNDKFKTLRESMSGGRRTHPFCRECDVLDAGEREKYIVTVLKNNGMK